MTNPTYFTVVADFKSVVVDLDTDVDADPQLGPVTAKVTFTPVLNNGDVILATNASPRPTIYVPAPIVARIDTDGKLKLRVAPDGDRDNFANLAAFPATGNTAKVYFAIDTQKFYRWLPGSSQYVEDYSYAQVRLLADTAVLELASPLYYKVTFSDVVYNGGPGYINSFTFQAPTSDTELNLVEVLRQPGQPAVGITKIAPGAVRAENGNLIFSFGGVDLDEPVPYTDVDVTLDSADISDGTPIGRSLITAASSAVVQAAAAPNPTAVKTAAYTASPGELVPADATTAGFTVTLPAAPASGSTIWVKKIDTTTNTVTVQRGNGTDVFNETNGPSLLQLAVPGESVQVQYRSGIWYVTGHSFAVPGLDGRYVRQGPDGVSGVYTIQDSNGANAIRITPTANAVNYLGVGNSAGEGRANPVLLSAQSSVSANVSIRLRPKGTGYFSFQSGPGRELVIFVPVDNAVNSWRFDSASTGNAVRAVASGTDTNVSMNLVTSGTGTVQANGVNVLLTGGALGTPSSGTLTNCTFPTLNQNTTGTAAGLSATLVVGSGGTGVTTLTGLVKGNGTSAMSAAVAGTDYVAPGGALGTPSSGTLTNCTFPTLNQNTSGTAAGLSATLSVGSGGTGATTLTGLVKGNGTSAMTAAVAGTDYVAPGGALGTPSSGTLTNCTFPTLNQNTSGTAAGLSATLVVGSGGTGVTTLTGLVKGNGTSAMTAAVAGTDFVAPGGALGTPSSGTLTNATGLPVSGITASTSTALGVGSIELGHATDTTLTRSAAGVLAVEGVDLVNLSSTQTLSGKTLSAATYTGAQVSASGSAFTFHNQTDRTTNFEQCFVGYSGNSFLLSATAGGTGSRRSIQLLSGANFTIDAFNSTSGTVRITNSTSGAGVAAFGVTSTCTNSSGLTYSALINPTMSQTGTGGYTTLLINTTETSNTGSGAKLLIDAQLAGSSKFSVSNAGSVTLADAATLTVGTSTGTKIGTATTQKIGFWNASPAVQPTAVADATDAATVITQVNALLSRLRTIGLIAT